MLPTWLKIRIDRRLWGLLAALVVGGFMLLAYVLWTSYRDAAEEAGKRALAQSQAFETYFDATLRRIDATLCLVATRKQLPQLLAGHDEAGRALFEQEMGALLKGFPELSNLRVMDREGRVSLLAGEGAYIQLADRRYFRELRESSGDRLVFSSAVASRMNGRHTFIVARALRDAGGDFAGVVAAAIDIAYLEQRMEVLRERPAGFIAILGGEHELLVRQPSRPGLHDGAQPDPQALAERIAGGERAGVLHAEGQGDDAGTHVLAFRRLAAYPFEIVVGVSRADGLPDWRNRVLLSSFVGIVLFVALAGLVVWMARVLRQERRALDELKTHRRQLREAQRLAQVGSWALEIPAGRLIWSDELYRIFETDPAHGPYSYQRFLDSIHPEDRQRVDDAYRWALKHRQAYEVEHRMIMPDGRIKVIRERGETQYDDAGRPLRTIGTTQDITDLRRMESQMELLSSVFEYSGEAIVITDQNNNIVAVNPAFTRLTGYVLDEVRGSNPRVLSAGRTSEAEYERMWTAIRETGFWQGEVWDRRKDGAVYPKWLSISVIRNKDGGVRHYIAHFTDISAERAAEAKLHHMAHHDMLTGLYNRFSLKDSLDHTLAVSRRQGGRLALMFIDLDRFKVINDTLGHHVGDELLIQVANRLRSGVRESDVVARLGGDEFVVMLCNIEHTSAVALIAEKLIGSLGEPYVVSGHTLYATPSIGIAIFPVDGNDGDALMKNADAAMYHAKTAGRNNFQFFDARMNDAALERLSIEHALRQALGRDEFRLHFQPVIDVRSGRVEGVEALVRWQHPERGLLPPGVFIGVAEETGLIQPLGEWVFWAACRQLADFRAAGIDDVRMGINISAVQMRNGNLPVLARGAIEAFSLNPGDLMFEITESVAMEQPDETVRALDVLHDMGVTLALDDFGTGYSSLSYLRMFALDHLKLDRSFVEEIGQDIDGQVICDATIGLAHNLGLRLIAEGVETEAQLAYLKNKGCDLVQGYLFSKPLPADEVLAFIRQRNF